jgi:hypothetical protein
MPLATRQEHGKIHNGSCEDSTERSGKGGQLWYAEREQAFCPNHRAGRLGLCINSQTKASMDCLLP